MTTLVEDLKRSIAQLEEEAPSSRLLKDFREQLAAIEYSDGKTAEQLYYSGNPVVPTCPPVTDDPMLPAMKGLEQELNKISAQVINRVHSGEN
jgi:hypothetical protein